MSRLGFESNEEDDTLVTICVDDRRAIFPLGRTESLLLAEPRDENDTFGIIRTEVCRESFSRLLPL